MGDQQDWYNGPDYRAVHDETPAERTDPHPAHWRPPQWHQPPPASGPEPAPPSGPMPVPPAGPEPPADEYYSVPGGDPAEDEGAAGDEGDYGYLPLGHPVESVGPDEPEAPDGDESDEGPTTVLAPPFVLSPRDRTGRQPGPRAQGPQAPPGPRTATQFRPTGPGGSGPTGPSSSRNARRRGGSSRPPGRRRGRLLALGLLVLFLIVLAGLFLTGNLSRLMGNSSPASQPSVSSSGTEVAPSTQPPPSQAASTPASGIASQGATSAPSSTSPAAAGGNPGATATPSTGPSPGTVCVTTAGWNTDPQVTNSGHRMVPIVTTDAAPHGNCDRVVFTLRGNHSFQPGTRVGIDARYVTSASMDPRGTPIDLQGYPAIKLVIMAPSQLPVHNGYVLSPHQLKALAAKAGGSFNRIRWVKYGGSFEGQTTLVVSVRGSVQDEHPFAAFSGVDTQGNIYVALDVAVRAHGDAVAPAPSSS